MQERRATHILSSYYAPRGHNRMYSLGMQLAQMYLSPNDRLIGIIGEAGSGKNPLHGHGFGRTGVFCGNFENLSEFRFRRTESAAASHR